MSRREICCLEALRAISAVSLRDRPEVVKPDFSSDYHDDYQRVIGFCKRTNPLPFRTDDWEANWESVHYLPSEWSRYFLHPILFTCVAYPKGSVAEMLLISFERFRQNLNEEETFALHAVLAYLKTFRLTPQSVRAEIERKSRIVYEPENEDATE